MRKSVFGLAALVALAAPAAAVAADSGKPADQAPIAASSAPDVQAPSSGDVAVHLKVGAGLTWEGTISRLAGGSDACVAGKPDTPQLIAAFEKQAQQGGLAAEIAKSAIESLRKSPPMYTVTIGAATFAERPSQIAAFGLTVSDYRAGASRHEAVVTFALPGQPKPISVSVVADIGADGRSGTFKVADVKPQSWDGPPLDVEGRWTCPSVMSSGGR